MVLERRAPAGGVVTRFVRHQRRRFAVTALERERAARADAEKANRLKDEFLATLSHELRTPLTSISGYVEMFIDESLGPVTKRQLRALGVMSRNCDRLLALMDNLLVLSRIDAGELRLRCRLWTAGCRHGPPDRVRLDRRRRASGLRHLRADTDHPPVG